MVLKKNLLPLFFFTAILLTLHGKIFAQQAYTAKDSIEVYNWLNRADDADFEGNLDESKRCVEKAMTLSLRYNFSRGEGFAWLKTADLKLKQEGIDGLSKYYDKAIRIGEKIHDDFLVGLCYFQRGQQAAQAADFTSAEKNYSLAQNYFSKTDSTFYTAVTFNELGFINEKKGSYDDAVKYDLKAITLYGKIGAEKEAANTKGNLGIIFFRMDKYPQALQLFRESAATRERLGDVKGLASIYGNITMLFIPGSIDSAKKYLALQTAYAEKSGARLNKAQACVNTVSILTAEKKYEEAMDFEMKAVALYEEAGEKTKLATRYINAAAICNLLNDSLKAENYFSKAEQLAKATNSKNLMQNLYQQKTDFYKSRNNFNQAYLNSLLYHQYRDSIVNEKTLSNIAALQTRYETEKKDYEIARLGSESQIKTLEIEKQKALIAGNKTEVLQKESQIKLLRQEQQLRDVQLRTQEEEIEKQVLQNKNNEQQLLLSVQQLQIAENEKKLRIRQLDKERLIRNATIGGAVVLVLFGILLFNRFQLRKKLEEQKSLLTMRNKISRDLHDDIGSTLTSIQILSTVSQKAIDENPRQARQMVEEISAQSKTIQQNMSDIVWAIRPDNDKVENLLVRMREYIAQTLEPQKIKTNFNVTDEALGRSLPMQHRKEILLIYKEAINNVLKHSGATEVTIQLSVSPAGLQLQVADNGSWKQKEASSGTGTSSIKQRAALLGGHLQINGTDSGTTVLLHIPIP